MILIGATVLGNEALIVDYVMPYLKYAGYDKFYIYDNSTDGSLDKVLSYNYDFVEIRKFELAEDYPQFDHSKSSTFLRLFAELKMKTMTKELDDNVWYHMTDFDEILFSNIGLKNNITMALLVDNFNYFAGKIINLVNNEENLSTEKYVHKLKKNRGFYWPYWGTKPCLFNVNSFKYEFSYFYGGNHMLNLLPEENVIPKNLNDYGFFYNFHLKYLTKNIFINKNINSFYSHAHDGMYFNDIEKLNDMYELETSTSFPLEYFFFQEGVNKGFSYKIHDLSKFEGAPKTLGDLSPLS